MMIFGIYDMPDGERSWTERKLGDISDALEFEYEKYFCGVGTFTLIIPRNSVFADKIYVGCMFIRTVNTTTDEYEGFIVKNILQENDTIKITGYDLNGLLLDRVTLYPEGEEKDTQSGFTETIVKHYVEFNCVASDDVERNFPRLEIDEDQCRGIENDAASPRLQCLADVVADILGAQNMGYRIYPSINKGRIFFEVYEAVDRTQGQSENNRVVLSFGRGNIAEMQREVGVTADKNTFYCEISDGAVQRYYKKANIEENEGVEALDDDGEGGEEAVDPAAKSGYDRREEYLKLNCELTEIEVYAEHEVADRYRPTDSLTIEAGDPLDYGNVYNVGDIVTVYDRNRSIQLDSIISAAEIRRTGTEHSVKITLGESKPKILDNYQKKNSATATTVRNNTGTGVGRPSEWDVTSEYFNFYQNRNSSPKNVAGTPGKSNYYAHAEGMNTTASGQCSHAEGMDTTASGPYSHAEGFYNTASGGYSHVEGYNNKISGGYSHAEGMGNTQTDSGSGICVHIEGYNHTATNAPFIHIEGQHNIAASDAFHAEGQDNKDTGGSSYAHIEGFGNTVSLSQASHSEGRFNNLSGSESGHLEGYQNQADTSFAAHAEGQGNKLLGGTDNHAEGMSNTVTGGSYSHAEGAYNSISNASASRVGGMFNAVTGGNFADVSGNSNKANGGTANRVGGMNNTVTGGMCNLVYGQGLELETTDTIPACLVGQYNEQPEGIKVLFCVGNGKSADERSNAIMVDSAGNLYITGDIYINGKKLEIGGTNE